MKRQTSTNLFFSLLLIGGMVAAFSSCQQTSGRQGSRSSIKGLTGDELKSSGKDRNFKIEDYLTNGKLIVTIVTDSNYNRLKRRMGASVDPTYKEGERTNIGVHPIPGLTKESFLSFMTSVEQTAKHENSMIASRQFVEWLSGSGGQNGFLLNPKMHSSMLQFSGGYIANYLNWIDFVSSEDKLPPEFNRDGSYDNEHRYENPGIKVTLNGQVRLASGKLVDADILLINKAPGEKGLSDRTILEDKQIFATPAAARARFNQSGLVIFNAMKGNSDLSGEALQWILGGDFKRSNSTSRRTIFVQNRCETEGEEDHTTAKLSDGFDVISMKSLTDARSFGKSNSQILKALTNGKKISDLVAAASVPEMKIVAVWTGFGASGAATDSVSLVQGSPESDMLLSSSVDDTVFDSGGSTGHVPAPQPQPVPQPVPQPQPAPQPQPIPDDGSQPQPDPSIPDDGAPPIPPLVPDDGIPDGDPLVLNLDGTNVIEAKKTDFGMTMFDIFGSGIKQKTAWISSGNGFLALDLNKNGKIDSVSEFFRAGVSIGSGVVSRSGFDHLATYDLDMNGRIDSKDPVFSELLVWRDVNGDGVSQSTELFALSEVAKSISLTHENISNQFKSLPGSPSSTVTDLGTFERLDGKMGAVQNLLLSSGLDLVRK